MCVVEMEIHWNSLVRGEDPEKRSAIFYTKFINNAFDIRLNKGEGDATARWEMKQRKSLLSPRLSSLFSLQPSNNRTQSKSRWDFIQFIIKYSSFVEHLLFVVSSSSCFHSRGVRPVHKTTPALSHCLRGISFVIGRKCYVNRIPLIMKIKATLKSLCVRDEWIIGVKQASIYLCVWCLFGCLFVGFLLWQLIKEVINYSLEFYNKMNFAIFQSF